MISDVALRWFVTVLFLFSAAVCVRGIITGRHSPQTLVSHTLHAVMALAMAVMAWPRGAELPTRAPMIFFAAAALWFAVITVAGRQHRVANGYHTLMMLAMAWMYAAMGGLPLRREPSMADMTGMHSFDGASGGHGGHAGHGSHSAGHAAGHGGGDTAAWVGIVNWVCAVGFAAAAVFWLYRYVTTRIAPSAGTADAGLGILCQFAMAAGMAIMFAVML